MHKLTIIGAKGRMGRALIRCAGNNPELEVAGAIDIGDEMAPAIATADVVIDFSAPDATQNIAKESAAQTKPIVIGTTGHAEEDRAAIQSLAEKIPIVWASNYSTGVNALFWLTRKAAEILGDGFDLEIIEMHHHHKQDSPSGTAATLANILAQARNLPLNKSLRHGRQGIIGPRTKNEIGMHSLRGGDVVGDHTVLFAALGERLELTHKASSRDTFANGALRAAKWILRQKPGLYSMQHVLGLDD